MHVCVAKMRPSVCSKTAYGVTFDIKEALEDDLIETTYSSTEELQSQIASYFKTYGAVSENRDAIKVNK